MSQAPRPMHRWAIGALVGGGLCAVLWQWLDRSPPSAPSAGHRISAAPTPQRPSPVGRASPPHRSVATQTAPDPSTDDGRMATEAPTWLPAELEVQVRTDDGGSVAYARVQGDCGVHGRADADGLWVGLVPPGPCELRAIREDGLLKTTSVPVSAHWEPGSAVSVTLELPAAVQGGLGLAVAPDTAGVVVRAVRPDSPADAAQVHPGDVVVAIDGMDTTGWDARRFAEAGTGAVGTSVRLELQNPDSGEQTVEITLERAWLPPGRTAEAAGEVAVPLASLSDSARRELASIRHALLALSPDGQIDPTDPEVDALIARARALAEPAD